MRVVQLTHVFPRAADDPLGAFLLRLIQGIGDRAEVHVIAPHAAGLPLQETLEGVPVTRFRYASDADETLAYTGIMHEQVRGGLRAKLRFIPFMLAYLRAARRAAREFQPQVIHAHWWAPGGFIGALVARWTKTPLMITTHGTDVEQLRRSAWARPLARFAFGQARAITCGSEYLRRQLVTLGVVDAARVRVIPMPVAKNFLTDDDRRTTVDGDSIASDVRPKLALSAVEGSSVGPPSLISRRSAPHHPSSFAVLTVARLTTQKGIDTLLEALAELRGRGVDATLRIVGDGAQRGALETKTRALGLEPSVTFLGTLPPRELPRLYAECDVFVLPSVREGMGLVLAEALLCGAPVIGTDSGGIPEIVRNEETGLTFPEQDARALADALERYAREPQYAAQLAARGRAWVLERFTPARVGEQFLEVYALVARR